MDSLQFIEQEYRRPQSLFDLLPKQIEKPKALRAQFIDEAVARINEERQGTTFKAVTARAIAIKIAHLDDTDIHFLMKRCRSASSYGRMFFGALKVKPESGKMETVLESLQ